MRDPRNARLAHVIVHHSTQLKAGEAIMIEAFDLADGLVLDLIDEVRRVQGIPVVVLRSNAVSRRALPALLPRSCRSTVSASSFASPGPTCTKAAAY